MTRAPNSSDPVRRAVIHVGTEKTGTTSLQSVLAENRDWLRGHGILFPKSAGKVNHTRLVACAEDDRVTDNIKAHIMASRKESEGQMRKNLRASLKRELSSGEPWHTLVLSSELIHSRLHTKSEIKRLISFIADSVDQISILAILRRQDQLAVSRFSTAIRAGHAGFYDVFDDIAEHAYFRLPPQRDVSDFSYYYDYENLINRFAPFVGDADIDLKLYHVDGRKTDPVQILAEVLQLDFSHLAASTPILNPAMSAEAQFVISQINKRIASHLPSGKRDSRYIALKRQIEADLTGPPRQIPRAEAQAFLARFETSNERLRSRFFPERKTLFDTDFSMYPENVDYSDFPEKLDPLIGEYIASLGQSGPPPSVLRRTLGKVRRLWVN